MQVHIRVVWEAANVARGHGLAEDDEQRGVRGHGQLCDRLSVLLDRHAGEGEKRTDRRSLVLRQIKGGTSPPSFLHKGHPSLVGGGYCICSTYISRSLFGIENICS